MKTIRLPVTSLFMSFLMAGVAAAAEPGNRLPPILKVDGLYVFDGSEDDLVKVLEVSPETGWARVQTKAGESWVNINNVTTVTPISREAALKTELRAKADFIRDGAMAISSAIDAYAARNNLAMDASFKWEDIRKFIPNDAPAYNSGGKDATGRPYIFGSKIEDHVKVHPETIKECAPVMENSDAYWGKFKS